MYDLTEDQIIDWAINYAGFEELESVAKALYGIYAQRRKTEYPELHKTNKKIRKKYNQKALHQKRK